MAGSDARRALTIHLARSGRTLLRAVDPKDPPRPTAPAPERVPIPAALEGIARTLDQGSADEVARLVSGSGAAEAGRALFEALFDTEAALTARIRDLTGDSTADARKQPLRVRVATADAQLGGLPYAITALGGDRLQDLGFTFEVTHEAALYPPAAHTWNHVFILAEGTARPETLPSPMLWRPAPTGLRDLRFPPRAAPPTALIVAPALTPDAIGSPGAPALDAAAHVRAARDGLAALGLPHSDPASIRVVRTAEDLARALAGMQPDVVHIFAYVDGDTILLEARGGDAARVPLADLAGWMAPSPPLALGLAGCPIGAIPFPAAFAAFSPIVPLVAMHRPGAWGDGSARAVLDALIAAIGADGDPVAGIRDARTPATVAVHGAYARWVRDEPARPPSRFTLGLRRALDETRAEALTRVEALARSADARVLALILPDPPRALGVSGARPLIDELDLAGRHLGRAKVVEIPPAEEGDDPLASWKRELIAAIDAEGTIEEALRRLALDGGWAPIGGAAPEPAPPDHPEDRVSIADRPGERGLIWLDFGERGRAPHLWITTAEISAWIAVAAEVIAPRCPPEIRVVCSIAVEVDADQRARLATWVSEKRDGLRARAPGFDVALLPAARALDRDEVRSGLEEAWPEPCPAALLDGATDAILGHAHGEIDPTLDLVARAHATSWAALIRELGEKDPHAPEDEEIF